MYIMGNFLVVFDRRNSRKNRNRGCAETVETERTTVHPKCTTVHFKPDARARAIFDRDLNARPCTLSARPFTF